MPSTIALVTVSYFSRHDVTACLASVPAAAATPPDVFVVNNAATDDLQSVLFGEPAAAAAAGMPSAAGAATGTRTPPRTTLLSPGANLGYGGAVNFAAERLEERYEWILVTNPDVEFSPGSIDELLAVASSDDRIGVVGPRITNDDGTIYPSARALPSLTAGAGHAVFHRVWPGNPWSKRYLRADKSKTAGTAPLTSGWLSGACLLVRRSAFEQIGGFDDRFFMYFEDVDLGERLGLAGWRVLYVPTASVHHAGGTSTKGHSAAMLRAHHRSAYLYLAKRYHQWYYLPVRVALRIGLSLRALTASLRS